MKDPELFRVYFRALLSTVALIGAFVFLYGACFNDPGEMTEHTGTVVGFITGSVVTIIISYYFGTNEGGRG